MIPYIVSQYAYLSSTSSIYPIILVWFLLYYSISTLSIEKSGPKWSDTILGYVPSLSKNIGLLVPLGNFEFETLNNLLSFYPSLSSEWETIG